MIILKQQNTNIHFSGRNPEIKKAQQILHKIKSEFPASSSYLADLLAQKSKLKSEDPNAFIKMSDIIETLNITKNIGAQLTTKNLATLRRVQGHFTDNDYKYCDSFVWGVKKFHVMNCKENAELAFLIAKMNGYKNIHCINLAKELPDGTFADLDHTVLLINQKLPKNIEKLDKFYIQDLTMDSAFIPSRKSIVIDPQFGIVDYWENAIQDYKSIFPRMFDVKQLWAGAKEEVIKSPKDIREFKYSHPEFIINQFEKENKPNLFDKIINYLHKKAVRFGFCPKSSK